MTNTNAALKAPSPAQQGLDELIEMGGEEASTPTTAAPIAPSATASPSGSSDGDDTTSAADYEGDDEELEEMNDAARVEIFFVHNAYDGMKDNSRVIQLGQTLVGTYQGSFTSGQHNSRTHKLLVKGGEYDGKVVGLPTCGTLNNKLQFVPQGTLIAAKYDGFTKIKTGIGKGKPWYNYGFKLPGSVKKAIEAKQLASNYELPPKAGK